MTDHIVKVPRAIITGDNTGKVYTGYLSMTENPPHFANLPKANSELIKIVRDSIISQCLAFRIDVSERLPTENRVHILETADFKKVADISGTGKIDPRLQGYYSANFSHILVLESEEDGGPRPPSAIARTLCHEFWHSLGFREYQISRNGKDSKFGLVKAGFKTKEAKSLFEEAFVEICNLQAVKYFWKENFTLNIMRKHAISLAPYLGNLVALDRVLIKVADDKQSSYKDIVLGLQRDFILGKNDTLDLIKNCLGEEDYNKLFYMERIKVKEAKAFIESFGIDFDREWGEDGKNYVYCSRL